MRALQNESDLKDFLREEVEKQKGVCQPVRAGFPERLLVRRVSCKRLHPNPADEFCVPEIGPNMGIVSNYVKHFLEMKKKGEPIMDEPLFVQKINTGGYRVLNGHHRWAAAMRLGIASMPVTIVNTASAEDIRKMIDESKNDRRVTFDLDEVVFCPTNDPFTEKSFSVIRLGIKRAKIRRGIPALFSFFSTHGYDIWVYSSNYYSIDDIDNYFKRYSVWINGIITGKHAMKQKSIVAAKYKETMHIDDDLILVTYPDKKDHIEIALDGGRERWSRDVMGKAQKIVLSGPEDK